MSRPDKRKPNQLRQIKLTPKQMKFAEGSCIVEWGNTKLICTASVEEKVPPFLRGSGTGWVSGEYGMLPRSTHQRMEREASRGRPSGRTQEIQRLIGRSLRAVSDLSGFGERTVWIDCDCIQADGGTRCAAITGGFVALVECFRNMRKMGLIERIPVLDFVAAASVGIIDSRPVVDLCYLEDSKAKVDMNVVMTGKGKFVEVQGTAERLPFAKKDLDSMLGLAAASINSIIRFQKIALCARTIKEF